MKLFSPKQAQLAHNHKQDEDIAQIAFLTIQLKKLQDTINRENDNWDKRLKEQRTIYGEEKIKLQDDVRELEEKLRRGETRLLELLIPIDGLKEKAEDSLRHAQETAKSVMKREEEVTDLQEMLTNKIDSLTERELQVGENEIKIENRLRGIEAESVMISESHRKLNEEVATFEKDKASKIKELAEKENKLNIMHKSNTLYLEARTKELDDKEVLLRDGREALARGFAELERLKKTING